MIDDIMSIQQFGTLHVATDKVTSLPSNMVNIFYVNLRTTSISERLLCIFLAVYPGHHAYRLTPVWSST